MNSNEFIALVTNVSLLIAMVFVYDLATVRVLNLDRRLRQVLVGLGLGVIAVATMSAPWVFAPGITFDARSVLIGITGLFFGALPTFIVMAIAATYRVFQGGAFLTGVSVIIASGLVGLVMRRTLKRPLASLGWSHLLVLGYAVHVVMLALMFTLPWQTAIAVLGTITLPVLTIYPLGTVAIGVLMLNRLRREQVAATVQESEVQFRALFEQAAVGVAKLDVRTGAFALVNRRYADLLGYTTEELLTADVYALTHPEDREATRRNMRDLVAGPTPSYTLVKRFIRKDGDVIWASVTASRLWRAGDEPAFAMAVIEDITARKDAEEALRQSERLLSEVQDVSSVGGWEYSVQTGLLTWTREVYRIYEVSPDYDPNDIHGDLQFYAANERALVETAFNRAVTTGEPYDLTVQFVTAKGNHRWVRTVGRPELRDGRPIRVVGNISDVTERKQAEVAIQDARQLAERYLDVAAEVILALDARGTITLLNASGHRLLGYAPGELVGRSWFDTCLPEDVRAEMRGLFGKIMTGEYADVMTYENAVITKSASRLVLLWHNTLLRDAGGNIVGALSSAEDITERRRAEEAVQSLLEKVREEEELKSRLLASMADEVWFADATGHFTLANPAACKAFRLEGAGNMDIQHFAESLEVLRPDGTPRPVEEAPPLRALAGATVIDQEEVVRLPLSGDLQYRLVNSSPVKDAQGAIVGCVSVVHDITERMKLEREVTHLASFPAQNPYPVIEVGTNGVVRFANAASATTLSRLGLNPDARQFLPGTSEELALLRSQCEKGPQTRELQLGSATFLRVVTAPPGDVSLRVYAVDITDRKKMDEEIRSLNASLEERVRRRTVELTAANRELEAFSYSVSHDLRAPLRSIDGFSQAFLEDYGATVPEEGRKDLDRVRNATRRMGQLIDDMLTLARVTRSEMHAQPMDVSAMAAKAAQDLAEDNPGRDIHVDIEQGMSAVGDPPLVRIVLASLLDNAWKFTSHREHAHVSVGTVNHPEHGRAFFVRDDGAGFDPKYEGRLFIAFQRLHAHDEFPGTGIGLATVERAVRRHGGEVWAQGEVDRGATFYFTIPNLSAPNPAKGDHDD